ncbi:hypothetical protein [Dyella sp. EPa41]|uniref:hypothetical protein n=1 Tax=Dyella sp. EPa41 TaxID=1561194 RepID=UPI0019166348|nr:hypothetical protein [Dyella sp. EPa41]
MSDFLGRVASRVMGGEALLVPRVPSLFEPAQRDVLMPVAEAHGAGSPQPANVFAEDEARRAPAGEAPSRSVPEKLTASRRLEPTQEEAAALRIAPIRSALGRDRTEPSQQLMHPVRASSDAQAIPSVMESRVRHEHVHQHVTLPARDADDGALLPPRGAVFPAQSVGLDHRDRGPSRHTARAEHPPQGVEHEPVVHVTIGRLEVRAGAAPASTPRHQEAPRRNAFDDYLRERGKASP